jgi:hypothetical protein
MRRIRLSIVSSVLLMILVFATLPIWPQESGAPREGRRGTAPRSSADKYQAHARKEGVSIGAELLTRKEVSKDFAAEVNRCCLVVQVALYPKSDEPLSVSLDDFTLIVRDTEAAARPLSPAVVSAKLEKKSGSNSGATTTGSVGVGYESGTYIDPVTGQPTRVRGVTTSASVGVGVGGGTPPTVAERDREVIERELSEKGLPEVKITVPVSGYLYFAFPKQKKDTKYRLEYAVKDTTLNLKFP